MAFDVFDNLTNFAADSLGLTEESAPVGGTSVSIAQIEGDQRSRTFVELIGRAMPYRGVEWEIEQRSKLTWYPGNPVATQQIFGSTELPTEMNGAWKDRFIRGAVVVNNDPEAVKTASEAVALFHTLARAGKQVRVQWLTEVRTGIIKAFRPTYDREQDVRWALTFEWNSRNDEVRPRSALEQTPASDSLNLLNLVEDIITLAPDIAAAFVASIVSAIDDVRERVSEVFNLLRIAETLVNLPSTLVGAIKSAVDELTRELGELIRRIGGGRSSAQDNITSTSAKGPTTSSISQGLSFSGATSSSSSDTQEAVFEGWRRTLTRALGQLRFQLQRSRIDIIDRTQPRTTRVVTVQSTDTLYSLAQRFYGSSDFANFLANTNGLQTAVVPSGFQLRVPPRPFGAAGNPEIVSSAETPC